MTFRYLDSAKSLNFTGHGKKIIIEGDSDDYTLNNLHEDTGYNNHSDNGQCNTHSHSGCNTHSDSGCDDHGHSPAVYVQSGCDTHVNYYWELDCQQTHEDRGYSDLKDIYFPYSERGCYTHTDSGCDDHSDSGCDDHSNSGCSTHINYTDNFSPVLSGVVTPNGGTFNLSVPIEWPAATDQLDQGSSTADTIVYELKFAYKGPTDTSFGSWQILIPKENDHSSTSYVWDTSLQPAGTYKVSVIAWDGAEYSATALESTEIKISHYQSPSWTTIIGENDNVLRKNDIEEIRNEINIAREAYGVTNPPVNWTDSTLVNNFTLIKSSHITELRNAVLPAREAAGKGNTFGWSNEILTTNSSKIMGKDLIEIRINLDDISG